MNKTPVAKILSLSLKPKPSRLSLFRSVRSSAPSPLLRCAGEFHHFSYLNLVHREEFSPYLPSQKFASPRYEGRGYALNVPPKTSLRFSSRLPVALFSSPLSGHRVNVQEGKVLLI